MHPLSSIKFYYYPTRDLIDDKLNTKFIELVLKYGKDTHRVLVFTSAAHEKIFKTKIKKITEARVDLTSPPSVVAEPNQAQSKAPWLFARES